MTTDDERAGRVREQLLERDCEGGCGGTVRYAGTGRPPRFCSAACRQRAWAIRTARRQLDADGDPRPEVVREVVQRVVEPPKPKPRAPRVPTNARGWADQLDELARQLATGRCSAGGGIATVAGEHWHHARLYRALVDVVHRLDQAHPGGLDRLGQRR